MNSGHFVLESVSAIQIFSLANSLHLYVSRDIDGHIYALVFEMLFLIWDVINILCGLAPYFAVSHQEYHALLE